MMAYDDFMIEKVINERFGGGFGNYPLDDGRVSIVFVHGAGGSHLMWLSQLARFRREYNTVAVNLPGHSLSPGKGCTSINKYVEFVLDFADELGLKKFLLVGLSMGGAISQKIALLAEERLLGLVLMSTGARLKVMPELFKMIKDNWDKYLEMFPKFAFSQNASRLVVEQALKEVSERDPMVVYADFQACDGFDVMDEVKKIKVKTLIISGGLDLLTPPKYMDYLHKEISGSRLIRYPDAGHIVNVEKPEEVNSALSEFFNELLKER